MFDLSCTSVIKSEKWLVCVMDWVNQGASITFFSSVYQIYIFLHIKICRCGIFHLNSIHVQIIVFNVLTILTNSKSRLFSEYVIGGQLTWNSFPAILAPPDVGRSRLSSSCANGACLSCKLWKWTPFAIRRTLSTDNMLPPSHCVWNVSIVMTTQMDTGVILSIRHEARVWTHCDHYNGISIKSKTAVIE